MFISFIRIFPECFLFAKMLIGLLYFFVADRRIHLSDDAIRSVLRHQKDLLRANARRIAGHKLENALEPI